MADVVYLAPGEAMPDVGDEGPWLLIEALDGKFYGSGGSFKQTGEWVGYSSLAEDDLTLETALEAAQKWSANHGAPTIWVQLEAYVR